MKKAVHRRAARPAADAEFEAHPASPLPRYDIDLRELSLAGKVMFRLPAQARSLAAILAAFQLAGWPPRIARPLSGRPGGNDPQHVADAVYALNHHQSLIEFRTDDAGVRWRWRPDAAESLLTVPAGNGKPKRRPSARTRSRKPR